MAPNISSPAENQKYDYDNILQAGRFSLFALEETGKAFSLTCCKIKSDNQKLQLKGLRIEQEHFEGGHTALTVTQWTFSVHHKERNRTINVLEVRGQWMR